MVTKPSPTFLGAIDQAALDTTNSNVSANTSNIASKADTSIVQITKYIESSEQVITPGGTITFAHTFGVMPQNVGLRLVCKTADRGYSVGDVIPIPPHDVPVGGNNHNCVVKMDATNIYLKFGITTGVFGGGGTFLIMNWASGGHETIINDNWRLIIWAVA